MITRRSALVGLFALPVAPRITAIPAPKDPLVSAARAQIGVTKYYNGAYVRLDYPGGDVALETGVCTDVIVRAYRTAFEFDLQKAVHEDMRADFSSYPKNWGLSRADKNIDHRRVPNLETFFKRKSAELSVPSNDADWKPGDLMTMRLDGNLPHIAIISDKVARRASRPLVLHNIGRGAAEDDIIGRFDNIRRFRFTPA